MEPSFEILSSNVALLLFVSVSCEVGTTCRFSDTPHRGEHEFVGREPIAARLFGLERVKRQKLLRGRS
jgi:hypothetical protein